MKKYSTVAEYLDDLDHNKKMQVEALRKIILKTEPKLDELIKWNSPSYVWGGEDRLTFNLHNKKNCVRLIFHMGATRKEDKNGTPVIDDKTGLMKWNSDIRGTLTFTGLDDIKNKQDSVVQLIKQWLATS